MIAYEVTVDVDEALVERYIAYIKQRHIPKILATACFAHAELDRATATRFRMTVTQEGKKARVCRQCKELIDG